jgi:predicted DNA-binding transcriptional regulator YafY
MASHPSNVEYAAVAIELLRRIPRHRKISAQELHSQLQGAGIQRNIRSIQRLLDDLSERFGIERDTKSKPYGYRILPGAKGLGLAGLSNQESLLLRLAEEHLKTLLPAPLVRSLSSFFDQARGTLAHQESAKLERQWMKKVRIVSTAQPLLPPKISEGVFEIVTEGLYENKKLDIDYKNAAGKRVQATILPLGLAQQGPRLYLVCRFEGFDNERSLALNRIQRAALRPIAFDPPKEFDLKKYDDDGRFGFGEGQKIKISFEITKGAGQHLLESRLSEDQSMSDKGSHFLVSATVVDSGQLDKWLLSFGKDVRKVLRTETKA